MSDLKKFLSDYGYCMYLGAALAAFADLYWDDWRVYAIILPTIILVVARDQHRKEGQ